MKPKETKKPPKRQRKRSKYRLADLLKGCRPDKYHPEMITGRCGRELI